LYLAESSTWDPRRDGTLCAPRCRFRSLVAWPSPPPRDIYFFRSTFTELSTFALVSGRKAGATAEKQRYRKSDSKPRNLPFLRRKCECCNRADLLVTGHQRRPWLLETAVPLGAGVRITREKSRSVYLLLPDEMAPFAVSFARHYMDMWHRWASPRRCTCQTRVLTTMRGSRN